MDQPGVREDERAFAVRQRASFRHCEHDAAFRADDLAADQNAFVEGAGVREIAVVDRAFEVKAVGVDRLDQPRVLDVAAPVRVGKHSCVFAAAAVSDDRRVQAVDEVAVEIRALDEDALVTDDLAARYVRDAAVEVVGEGCDPNRRAAKAVNAAGVVDAVVEGLRRDENADARNGAFVVRCALAALCDDAGVVDSVSVGRCPAAESVAARDDGRTVQAADRGAGMIGDATREDDADFTAVEEVADLNASIVARDAALVLNAPGPACKRVCNVDTRVTAGDCAVRVVDQRAAHRTVERCDAVHAAADRAGVFAAVHDVAGHRGAGDVVA